MTSTRLVFSDPSTLSDFATFARRAIRLDNAGAMRVQGFAGGIACYVAPLYPTGLADRTPTVLGVRTFSGTIAGDTDITVALLDIVQALGDASGHLSFPMPEGASRVAWAAVTPPQHGWQRVGELSAAAVRDVLAAGVADVADGTGTAQGVSVAGALAVHTLRGMVWGRVDAFGGPPAGVALALDGLGFLAPGAAVSVLQAGPWFRLSGAFGDVIARSRPSL